MKEKWKRKTGGYCVAVTGIIIAPLLPFWGFALVSLLIIWMEAPVAALFFAILIDSFLVPGGVAPPWNLVTVYTTVFLSLYLYMRYNNKL